VDAWDRLAEHSVVESTMAALRSNNIEPSFVETGEQAIRRLLDMLPEGAEVMNMTSMTLQAIGAAEEITESGRYQSLRSKVYAVDQKTHYSEIVRLRSVPDWVVGSVHAVTQEGTVFIASRTGSQLAAYAYGAMHVIWVVGTHKIVADDEQAMRRIYERCLPLEAERVRKLGQDGSAVNKVLRMGLEMARGRINLIFVNEALGF
jgi:hypothetical protein